MSLTSVRAFFANLQLEVPIIELAVSTATLHHQRCADLTRLDGTGDPGRMGGRVQRHSQRDRTLNTADHIASHPDLLLRIA